MGICGATPQTADLVIQRMAAHIGATGGRHHNRWMADGLGLLRFHHGVVNPHPQPAANEDGSLLAAMDGEVFGTRDMRRRLVEAGHRFRYPDCDAELVLHLYEEDGEAAFRALNGSFSVAIYQPASGRLLLVTDPFFSRPIYYCRMGEGLVFSSRFNALVACGALDGGRLDMTAVMQFFTFQHCQYESTYYREARAMLPSSVLEFAGGRVSTRRYWRLHYVPDEGTEEEFVERLAEGIRRSVRLRTGNGVRTGVLLSGGLDSRTLVAASDAPMRAYTVGDYMNREVRTARRVARTKGWRHVFLQREPDHYARMLDEAVELSGGMGRYDHCQFLGQLERPQAECDALFVEEPMDALFKGVSWAMRPAIRGVRVPMPAHRKHTRDGLENQVLRIDYKSMLPSKPWLLFREPWRGRYREMMYSTVREQMADAGTSNPYDLVVHVAALSSFGRIANFLNVTCVRPCVEYRSLCLDRDLLELSTHMPVRYRMGGRVLVEALKRLDGRIWSIPNANTGMRVDTPELLAWLVRMGGELATFVGRRMQPARRATTSGSWSDRAEVLRMPPLRDMLEDTLFDEACFHPDLFDVDRLRQVRAEHMTRKQGYMRMLLCLLTFGRWFREHGPRVM